MVLLIHSNLSVYVSMYPDGFVKLFFIKKRKKIKLTINELELYLPHQFNL